MTSIKSTSLRPVIGLEVHAQLLTRSKMFCRCSTNYVDSPPNSHVCAVCSGMPGSLPVINRAALEDAIVTALALRCRLPEMSRFDRKNYSYPDLPKGYQISQYDHPVGLGGCLQYRVDGQVKECGIVRVHLEEDTGKLVHTNLDGRDVTLVDYNRSGIPLMEIVSAPELHAPEEARAYFEALRQVLMYLGVNDGNLQEGSLRADVNVSLQSADGQAGTKVEIKNLNSFRAVQRALEYEIERQAAVLLGGGNLEQETRGWSERDEKTVPQRSKEYAHDYRYFPEPDLPPLAIEAAYREELAARLPELPVARSARFQEVYGLSPYTAGVLTAEKETADFFEQALAAGSVTPGGLANWLTGDMARLLNESGETLGTAAVAPNALARLVAMIESGEISSKAGKHVLDEMFASGNSPEDIVQRENLAQIVDEGAIEELVDQVLEMNPALVEQYRAGKTNVVQALISKTLAASKGKASPPLVRQVLERKLSVPA